MRKVFKSLLIHWQRGRMVMEFILDKLRSKLVFDWNAHSYVEQHGTLLPLDPARFVYFTNDSPPPTKNSAPQTVFVDGGSAEFFSSADFSLYRFRISAVHYHGTKRLRSETREFSAFLDFDDEKAVRIQLVGIDEAFSQEIHQLAARFFAAHPSEDLATMGAALLQLGELAEMHRISAGLKPKDIIVRDGSLDIFFEICHEANEMMKQKQVFVCGLAKTNTLRTTNGHSVSFVLEKKSNVGAWHYPLTKHLFFVKLHEKTKHVFRCDVNLPHYSVFAALAAHAADPVFLGYPYGLIEADRMARVSNDEAAFLRKEIKMKLGKDAANLDVLLGTSETHEILDKIRF